MKKENLDLALTLAAILELKPREEGRRLLKSLGLPFYRHSNAACVVAALVEKARDGDLPAIKEIISLAGKCQKSPSEVSKLCEALDREVEDDI